MENIDFGKLIQEYLDNNPKEKEIIEEGIKALDEKKPKKWKIARIKELTESIK